MDEVIEQDRKRIADLGGPARVADLLKFDKSRGTQRVHNWCSRGIPAAVKVKWPDLFLHAQSSSDVSRGA